MKKFQIFQKFMRDIMNIIIFLGIVKKEIRINRNLKS